MEFITIKEVEIPACSQHLGLYKIKVKLKWTCPTCGKPRGEIRKVRSYDGSLYMECDGWSNSCGHIDLYAKLREEARTNGLNYIV